MLPEVWNDVTDLNVIVIQPQNYRLINFKQWLWSIETSVRKKATLRFFKDYVISVWPGRYLKAFHEDYDSMIVYLLVTENPKEEIQFVDITKLEDDNSDRTTKFIGDSLS